MTITNAVLDTNVLVSGLLSPSGNSALILNALRDRRFVCCYSYDILSEYINVLLRPKFGFCREEVENQIESIRKIGRVIIPRQSVQSMPDDSDRVFYDTAKTICAYLVTGNAKHYPDEPCVITPAKFLNLLDSRQPLKTR